MKTNCYICKEILKKEDHIIVTNKFSYLICPNCHTGILNPKPSFDQVYKLYDKKTYFIKLSAPVKNKIQQWILTKRIFKTPQEWVASKFPIGKILDVGCGNGEFMKYLKDRDWSVYGTDLSPEAVRNTGNLVGKDNVYKGQFHKQNIKEKFDMISFWHILEHIDNPVLYLKKAHMLLRKGGYVVGESPNFDSINIRVFKKNYNWVMVPDHLIYYNQNSLKELATQTGFDVEQIIYPPRALLNFAMSVKKALKENRYSPIVCSIGFVLMIPISIIVGILSSQMGKSEVIRFILKKR